MFDNRPGVSSSLGLHNMKIYDKNTGLIWAKMEQYQRKKSATSEIIGEMLKAAQKPYIAFSCGKDSSVLADLILRQNPKIKMRFISSGETRLIHNIDDVIEYFKQKYEADIEEINIDRIFGKGWECATFDEQRKAGRRDIQSIDNSGYDAVFMGLRKQESRGRAITLRMCKTEGLPPGTYKYKEREYYRFCPIMDWRTEDIAAYIAENSLPVLDWYNKYGFEARTTARLTGDAVRQNAIFYLKLYRPESYAILTERFPELKIYS